ncbi:ABC transporter substrate-binding protein [Paenibacillus radicis (ex Xue et al. 2023)]|uniref:ABC transporter substrate-binding protein n=1 Tax=Paenibacillus radicis (ex Xue et al. 2023) TaxID=2972489 RepID=A0ABT1YAH6_9BACL|nr:ABC transporter substrate-binding protein [Paenibacillus radicis (ex Xue et al. 2023)]MCR8630196.1 ABC transporter substrate-binding protein [Paenibacillus radicis (ex Xue et al. 2023)]
MKRKLGLTAVLALAVLSAGCTNVTAPIREEATKAGSSDEIVVSIKGEPAKGFDPAFDWPGMGEALFQSKLVMFDKDMNIVNDLATKRTISADGKKLTLNLRQDVLYSDGKKFTAGDVVFTFEKVRETTSYIDLSNIEKVIAEDDYTVTFQLKNPDSNFEYTLTRIAIIPKHVYNDSYGQHPIGSGPYKFVEWQKGQKLIIEANPSYYGKKPNIKKVTFLYLDMDASFAGAKRGEIDLARVSMDYIGKPIPGYSQRSIETMDIVSISLPTVKRGAYVMDGIPIGNDVTSDPAIRRALSYGMDRAGIAANALNGGARPVYSHNPGMPWDNEANNLKNADVDAAKRILKEGGWADTDQDGIVEKNGKKAEFTLLYTPGEVERQAVVLGAQESAKKIGIKINLEAKVWDEISNQKLLYKEAYLFGKGADSPFEIYTNFSSDRITKGTTNSPSYKNEQVDEYLRKAIQTTNQKEAMELWKKAQWDGKYGANSLGDSPFIPMVAFHHTFYIKNDVEIGDFRPAPHRGAYWITVDNIKDWVKK